MDQNPAQNSAQDLGGLSLPPAGSTGTGANTDAANVSAATGEIRRRKQRSDAGQSRGTRGASPTAIIQPLSSTQFAKLYDPELWGKTLAAPADAMAFITGRKHWEISPKEKEALGATGSIAAQCFAVSDPRWLALSLALITVIDVYGVRLAMDIAVRTKEADERKAKIAKQGAA